MAAKKKTKKKVIPKAMPTPKVVLPPEVKAARKAVAVIEKDLAQPKAWMSKKVIKTEKDYTDAGTVLAWTKRALNEMDAKRKTFVGPLNKVVKLINAEYKQVKDPTEKVQSHVAQLMGQYVQKKEDDAKAEVEEHAVAAEEAGELDFAMDLRDSAVIDTHAPKLDSVKAIARWHCKVEDLDILLSELVQGHSQLQGLRPKLVDMVEKELGALARATKRTDIGVPGAIGVKETSFNLKS